eukprot:6177383-Pleurochrysis_carterae.AAC.3
MRVPVCKENRLARATSSSKPRTTTARKSRKSERLKNLVEMSGREKKEDRDGAGGVYARAFVATVNARPAGKLLKRLLRYFALTNALVWSTPVLTSDRHALRHITDCRFSARSNLHRDLDLAAGDALLFALTVYSGLRVHLTHGACAASDNAPRQRERQRATARDSTRRRRGE